MKEFKPVYLLYVAIGIGIIWIFSKTAEKVGLVESKEDRKIEKNLSFKWLTPKPFLEWKKKNSFTIPSQIENFVFPALVNKIYEAKDFFNDDENLIYSFFRDIQSKRQISMFAYYFKELKGISLNSFLDSFLSPKEIQKIVDIIKNKPDDKKEFYEQ